MTSFCNANGRMKRGAAFALVALAGALPAGASELDLARAAGGVVEGTNALRRSHGLEAVTVERRLNETARDFAAFLARTDRFEHTADGRRPEDRAKGHGYDYCLVAENIAYEFRSRGFDTGQLARALVAGWTNSAEHRRNMLDRDATEIGVGLAQSARTGRYYGVQVFGRPRSAAIEFAIENRSRHAVAYRVGERAFTLEPRTTRTHRECGSAALVTEFPQEPPSQVPLKDRDRFVVVDDRGGPRLRRAPLRRHRRQLLQ